MLPKTLFLSCEILIESRKQHFFFSSRYIAVFFFLKVEVFYYLVSQWQKAQFELMKIQYLYFICQALRGGGGGGVGSYLNWDFTSQKEHTAFLLRTTNSNLKMCSRIIFVTQLPDTNFKMTDRNIQVAVIMLPKKRRLNVFIFIWYIVIGHWRKKTKLCDNLPNTTSKYHG